MDEPSQLSVAEEFDKYESRYEDTVNDALAFSGLSVDYFTKVKADHLLALLSRQFGDLTSLKVLDVGCGIGSYHSLLRPALRSLHGVDVSQASVDRARLTNTDVDYRSYAGSVLPYADGEFDVAFTICVIHHVPPSQWTEFVSEIGRVLRPGGIAVVYEHNPRNPLTQRVVNRCLFDRDAVLLSDTTAMRHFTTAAFPNPQLQHILTIPTFGPVTRSIDAILGRARLGAQYCVWVKRAAKP